MKKILPIILLLFFAGCKTRQTTSEMQRDNEYQIYSLILEALHSGEQNNGWVIFDNTVSDFPGGHDNASINKALVYAFNSKPEFSTWDSKEIISNYLLMNKAQHHFTVDSIKCSFPLFRTSRDSILSIVKDSILSYWKVFRKTYPNMNGNVSLSRVGFNSNYTQAIVYRKYSVDFLNAEGVLIILKKENNVWKIVSTVMLWIS